MQWEYDATGAVIPESIRLTYQEAKARGWFGRNRDRVPRLLRPVVARLEREHCNAMERQRLQEMGYDRSNAEMLTLLPEGQRRERQRGPVIWKDTI